MYCCISPIWMLIVTVTGISSVQHVAAKQQWKMLGIKEPALRKIAEVTKVMIMNLYFYARG